MVAALVTTTSAAAFTPTNAYYAKQWYLNQDNAFDARHAPPPLDQVKVAVIDSGVDCSLPDLKGQIAKAKSFVGGNACDDHLGHGTIVAGDTSRRARKLLPGKSVRRTRRQYQRDSSRGGRA